MPEENEHVVVDLLERVNTLLHYVQAAERIRGMLATSKHMVTEIDSLYELDNELGPELRAATEHLADTVAALERCFEFCSTRMNVRLEKGMEE